MARGNLLPFGFGAQRGDPFQLLRREMEQLFDHVGCGTWLARTLCRFARIRAAISRCSWGAIMRSSSVSRYQLGFVRQAARSTRSSNTDARAGFWEAASTDACARGKSCANPFGQSPAWVITVPTQEWPTRTTGPASRSIARVTSPASSDSELSWFCTATTRRPAACSLPTTSRHVDPSAQAPWTSTTEGDRVAGAPEAAGAMATAVAMPIRVSPLGRIGSIDEVANVVTFFASDFASYINGTELYVDGGLKV